MRHYDVQVFGGGHDEAAQHTENNIVDLTNYESQHPKYKVTQCGPDSPRYYPNISVRRSYSWDWAIDTESGEEKNNSKKYGFLSVNLTRQKDI